MFSAHITGTGSALPGRILTNQDLENIVDTSDEWITRRTGIKERRIAKKDAEETTADLGSRAALAAMQMAGITADVVDNIIVATVTADRQFPSAACMIQQELNANNAAAYDVSAGCSGFIYGIELAANAIKAGTAETILVIGAERLSSVVNWKDRGTCVLLGDGTGAVVVQRGEDSGGILSTHIKSDGRLWDLLYAEMGNDTPPDILADIIVHPIHLCMEGNRLFKKAVGSMVDIAGQALSHNNLSNQDVHLVVPHQANLRIIQSVAEKLQIPMEKFFTNLQKYGNTSAASIPIAMDEALRSGAIKKDDYILLVSFGAGLTWGASIIRWSF